MRRILLLGGFLAALACLPSNACAQTTPAPSTPAPAQPASAQPLDQVTVQAPAPSGSQAAGKPKPDTPEVESAMAQSLAKQRMSLMKQVASAMGKPPTPAASFFTVPWVETPVPFSQPPCDPVPAAELDKMVLDNAQQQGVKEDLIRSVITQESGGRPCAVSWKGAQGLMQLMPATAQELGVKNPFDPRQSIEGGTRLLKQLLVKYKDDVSLALAAYNAGEGSVDKAGGIPQIPETQNYVNSIQSKLPKN